MSVKQRLIKEYGEKKANALLEKYSEKELFELEFLIEEVPEDPSEMKNYYEAKISNLEKEVKKLSEVTKSANESDAGRRIKLKETEDKLAQILAENETLKTQIETEKGDLLKQLNDVKSELAKYSDYDVIKQTLEQKTERDNKYKEGLLSRVDEKKREIYSKLDVYEIMDVLDVTSDKTPALNSGGTPQQDTFLSSLSNLGKQILGENNVN